MKTKSKKLVKKTIEQENPYHLEMVFNGFTFIKDTYDLERTIIGLKPEELLTEMYITVSKDEDTRVRKLTLVQGRKLFQDKVSLEIFINNLLIK